jgi:NADPH:quinone reductase-like Zn-dependent oxidoreductase
MRAVVHEKYGAPDVLHLADVEQPVANDDEVLVKVHATTVNRTDCGFRQGKPFFVRFFSGLIQPNKQILGTEFGGEVVAAGSAVTQFRVGDDVFGVNADRFGAHAEFVCVRETGPIAAKPEGMSFEEAASVCDGAVLARTCLRGADLEKGQRILIYGASGSIGTAAVQLAKSIDAHVTAVCNTKNVEIVRSLGADEVIDYTQTDFTSSGETYDVVFDSVGKTSFRRCRRLLNKGGVYVETDLGFLWHVPLLALATRWVGSKRVTLPIPRYTQQHVVDLKALIEAGKFRAVIDRRYPLEQVVEATRYVETQQKTGNVVLTVGTGSSLAPGGAS